jgi:hypothetical protein
MKFLFLVYFLLLFLSLPLSVVSCDLNEVNLANSLCDYVLERCNNEEMVAGHFSYLELVYCRLDGNTLIGTITLVRRHDIHC